MEDTEKEPEKIQITKIRGVSFEIDPRFKDRAEKFMEGKKDCKLLGASQVDSETIRISWLRPDDKWDVALLDVK